MAVPLEYSWSKALRLIDAQGWEHRDVEGSQVNIRVCPFCKKDDWKFYVAIQNPEVGNKDGLFLCHHAGCRATGNLQKLEEKAGVRVAGVDPLYMKGKDKQPDALPNVEECHSALLGDAEAMDYLVNVRGFSEEVIRKFKLGVKESQYFRVTGTHKAIVIPYLINNSVTYAKYRTMPPVPKDFASPSGYDVSLYNGEILRPGLEEIIFVEGEYDALSCLSQGIENVVGVPGANMRKAEWIKALDEIQPKNIYILYDSDTAGKKGSQELASRIGIERCLKIVLPSFTVMVDGVEKPGKDIGEWFKAGHTLEEFNELKNNAQLFDVTGVSSTYDAIEQLEDEIRARADLAPKYVSKWKSFNKLVGFEDGDVIDILAPEKTGKTTFGLILMDDMVETYEEDGLIICLEMERARMVRKWISKVTGFEDKLVEKGTPEAGLQKEALLESIKTAKIVQQGRKGTLYFCYPPSVKSPDDIYKLIIDCIRRYGVKWVMLDNLQLLCDMTLGDGKAHRTVHLSQISKTLTRLTKDYRIKMVRILQPRQIADNEMVQSTHTDGSSQVRKDCDCLITLWRSPTAKVKRAEWDKGFVPGAAASFDSRMKVGVALSRYSAGGECELWFDGARSQVNEEPPKLDNVNYNDLVATQQTTVPTEGI